LKKHVFVVSSTLIKPEDGWMHCTIYDQGGQPRQEIEQENGISHPFGASVASNAYQPVDVNPCEFPPFQA
jgi:hypothetical protein